MKKTGKKLSELSSAMTKYPQVITNVKVRERKEISEMSCVVDKINQVESVLGNEGRVFVRYSGTENLKQKFLWG